MPLYLFWGEEDFNIELEVNKLKNEVLGDEIGPMNYKTLDNPPFTVLSEALRITPMMFGNVLYIIKAGKYFLESTKKFTLDEKQVEELIEGFEMLSPSVHVVFLCHIPRGERKKPDSRKKLYKGLAKYGEIKEFEAFKPYEDYKISPWLKSHAQKKGIQISNDVALKLIQVTGASLRDLDVQLEKLKLLAHPETVISGKMVDEIASVNQDIFRLCDLILEKKYEIALDEISNLLEKSHFLEILAFLQTSLMKLLQTKLYGAQLSGFELAKKLGQHEFVVKKNMQKLARVDLSELVRLKQNLTNSEFMIKTGAIQDPLLAFQLAFISPPGGNAC